MKYFQHDTDARRNRKIRKVLRTHGPTGGFIWWSILEELYTSDNDGFQIHADELWLESFAESLCISDYRTLIRVFDTLAEIGLIDSQLWQEHYIYVHSIKERGDKYVAQKSLHARRQAKYRAKKEAQQDQESDASLTHQQISGDGETKEVTPSEIRDQNSEIKDQEKKEKSTANADAAPPQGEKSKPKKPKGPPKTLTKRQCQKLVETYQELKPELWSDVQVLNDKRVDMADRAYQACNRDIEATQKIVERALRYVNTQAWWTDRKFTFGTLFERGNQGQGDYRFIHWAEKASDSKAKQGSTSNHWLTKEIISDEEAQRIMAINQWHRSDEEAEALSVYGRVKWERENAARQAEGVAA